MFTCFPVDHVSLILTFGFRGGLSGVVTDCKYDGWSTLLSCSCETVTGIMFDMLSGEALGEDVGLAFTVKVGDGFRWEC